VTDVLRDRVEAELDHWLAPYYAARDGDDPQLAMRAAEAVLDRVYGRAKTTSEISGPDGGEITLKAIAEAARQQLSESGGRTQGLPRRVQESRRP
jgi:hypothetical protein